jgi:hypothetical protein
MASRENASNRIVPLRRAPGPWPFVSWETLSICTPENLAASHCDGTRNNGDSPTTSRRISGGTIHTHAVQATNLPPGLDRKFAKCKQRIHTSPTRKRGMRSGFGRFPRLRVGLVSQAYDQGPAARITAHPIPLSSVPAAAGRLLHRLDKPLWWHLTEVQSGNLLLRSSLRHIFI